MATPTNRPSFLVAGGAGFIGSHLCFAFRQRFEGSRVVALDNLHRRGSELQIPRLLAAGVEFVHGDVRNPEDLAATGPCDVVVDVAAETSVLAGIETDPGYLVRSNLLGTINALNHAREHQAGFIFLSTSRVYPIERLRRFKLERQGDRFVMVDAQELRGVSSAGINERFPIDGPRTLYGASKLASEVIISDYVNAFDVTAVVNRCGVVAGPWQMARVDQGIVGLWCSRHVFGGSLDYISWDGYQVRDAIHVLDLVDLIVKQISMLPQLKGRVFNVGGGLDISFSLRELTELCRTISGRTVDIGRKDEIRLGDIPYYVSDASQVREACGWEPRRRMPEIVQDTLAWIEQNAAQLRQFLA